MDREGREKLESNYYKGLAKTYLVEARRFVPKYDEIVKNVVEWVVRKQPETALDIGSGIGNVEVGILEHIPTLNITAIEKSAEMATTSREVFDNNNLHVDLRTIDIIDFDPDQQFDVVFSNMTLHNISFETKEPFLKKLHSWIEHNGIFVWGDLIKYDDVEVQKNFVEYRRLYGLERGGSEEFANANFEKESLYDFPYTIQQTFRVLESAGFSKNELVWLHDTFAMFVSKK